MYDYIREFPGWNDELFGHGLHKAGELFAHLGLCPGTLAAVPCDTSGQAVLERQIDIGPNCGELADVFRPQGENPLDNENGSRLQDDVVAGAGVGRVIVDGPVDGVSRADLLKMGCQ